MIRTLSEDLNLHLDIFNYFKASRTNDVIKVRTKMNHTTEYPPQSVLDLPGNHPVGDGGSGVNQVLVAFASLSVIFVLVFVVFMAVFFRRRRTNRKIYIPVTPNFSILQNNTSEGHPKLASAVSSQGHMPDIFESLAAVTKETDDEDDASDIRTASHCEGMNLNLTLKHKAPGSPAIHVPSRGSESKHSRSLPSLKHLSAHEEALSYLALSSTQGSANSPCAKTQTLSGVFSSNNENGFIRSRSFNERIAFGLNISRHSLSNRNRINVTALNRCMTSTAEPDARPKMKGKESVKSRKQKNVRGSFIKSMRISNLVEFIPTSLSIKKRFSNSVARYRKSAECSKTQMANASALPQTQPFAKMNSHSIDIDGIQESHRNRHRPVAGDCNNSERLLESLSHPSFQEELGSSHRGEGIQRCKSCVILVSPSDGCKLSNHALKMGNAISFNQLEEYSKKFSG